MSTVVMKAE